MNILENAEKYAEGKANQAITKAIADAYIEGYKAGSTEIGRASCRERV